MLSDPMRAAALVLAAVSLAAADELADALRERHAGEFRQEQERRWREDDAERDRQRAERFEQQLPPQWQWPYTTRPWWPR